METSPFCAEIVHKLRSVGDGTLDGVPMLTLQHLFAETTRPTTCSSEVWEKVVEYVITTNCQRAERGVVDLSTKHSYLLNEGCFDTAVRTGVGCFDQSINGFLYGEKSLSALVGAPPRMSWSFALIVDGRPGFERVTLWPNSRAEKVTVLYGAGKQAPCVFLALVTAFVAAHTA